MRAATKRLASLVIPVPDRERLESLLGEHVESSLVEPPAGTSLSASVERRRSVAGDTLLLFNESWSPLEARLRFTRSGGSLTLWDPRSGSQVKLRERVKAGDVISVDLEAAETFILTLGLGDPPHRRP